LTREAYRDGHVVKRIAGFPLIEEPEPLLGEGRQQIFALLLG
jgi:hypothetical protein